jgi:hypothetical protein
MWVWAEETQLNPKELKKNLFLAKDKDGYIAWHRAAQYGRIEVLETLRSWATDLELNLYELMLTQGCFSYFLGQFFLGIFFCVRVNRIYISFFFFFCLVFIHFETLTMFYYLMFM